LKLDNDDDLVTAGDRLFHTRAAATRKRMAPDGRRLLNVSSYARPATSLTTAGVVRKQRQTHNAEAIYHVDNGTPSPPDGIRFYAVHATSEDHAEAVLYDRASGHRKPV